MDALIIIWYLLVAKLKKEAEKGVQQDPKLTRAGM